MKQLVIAEPSSRKVRPLDCLLTPWQKNLRSIHHAAEISKGETVVAVAEVAGAVIVPAAPVEEEPTQNTDKKPGLQTRTAGTMRTNVTNKVIGL